MGMTLSIIAVTVVALFFGILFWIIFHRRRAEYYFGSQKVGLLFGKLQHRTLAVAFFVHLIALITLSVLLISYVW